MVDVFESQTSARSDAHADEGELRVLLAARNQARSRRLQSCWTLSGSRTRLARPLMDTNRSSSMSV